MRDPEAHQGKTILWGGEILSIVNRKDGTLLEVLQKPLDFENRPKEVDSSGGRFMAFIDRYLDPAVYAEGRQVSVAGPIQGKEQRAIGEIQYVYPVVRVVEIHLWPKRVHEPMYYYPDPFWYDRWWWRYPYPYRYPYRWH
jgi:outer membrane lipoprotein